MKNFLPLCFVLTFSIFCTVSAQERAAGGALETQMTWSTLATQVKAVDGKVGALDSKINMVTECGKNGKIYAPGAPGNVNGCIPAVVDMTVVNNILNCSTQGKFFDGTGCKSVTAEVDKTIYPDRILCRNTLTSQPGYMPFDIIYMASHPSEQNPSDGVWYGYAGDTVMMAFDRKTSKFVYQDGHSRGNNDCAGKSIKQIISMGRAMWTPAGQVPDSLKGSFKLPK